MGSCSSKNKIHVVSACTPRDNSGLTTTRKNSAAEKRQGSGVSRVKSAEEKWAQKRTDSLFGSRDSLGGVSDRGGSATSKVSKRSMDSGFDDKDHVISEESDPTLVQEIENGFRTPRKADDMLIVGKAVTQRQSAKDRERLDEQRVLASLHEEGLIARPVSRAAGGLSFEVIADPRSGDPLHVPRPPARLAKLERRKKKKRPLTEEEIAAKLEKARLRKEKLERERLEKIQEVTHKSDVQNALDAFAQSQMAKEEQQKSKEEIAAENREKKLREMQEKLRLKKQHAEEVRKRKMITIQPVHSQSHPGSAGSRKFRETDSIIASGSMDSTTTAS